MRGKLARFTAATRVETSILETKASYGLEAIKGINTFGDMDAKREKLEKMHGYKLQTLQELRNRPPLTEEQYKELQALKIEDELEEGDYV